MSGEVNLGNFRNDWYYPGRNKMFQMTWFFSGLPLLRSSLLPFSGIRRWLLRFFGAKVGAGVVIKPGVRVKYPWLLKVGKNSWLGEDCWIDNMALVEIGENVCISQGVYLCTGNHDWSDPTFSVVVKPITLRDGSWIGAKSVICPGVTVGECGVTTAGSTVSSDVPPFEVHAGNPAHFVHLRNIRLIGVAATR